MARTHVRRIPRDRETVTLGEVARRLERARSTVYLQALRGELPVVWRADRFEMLRSDLERLIAEHSPAGGAAA